MKQGVKPTKQAKTIGYLACGLIITGLATVYSARKIHEYVLPELTAVSDQTEVVLAKFDTTATSTDDFSTMPPPPDMGAILAAQRTVAGSGEQILPPAEVDPTITGATLKRHTPVATDVPSVPDPGNTTLVSHTDNSAELVAGYTAISGYVPIPVPSPKRSNLQVPAPGAGKSWKSRKGTPDILVLGDSQISDSAGPSYQKFFSNIPEICKVSEGQLPAAANIDFSRTASLGVRSTSLHSWVARSGAAKGLICDVDKKWGVNAGVWGIGGNSNRKYVQIGKGRDYDFCRPRTSAFESMFADGYYNPKLLVMVFLGNSADRWARSKRNALEDVKSTLAQIPEDTACIFLTSAPVYSKRVNDVRMRAQKNIARAFSEEGKRCTVVAGITSRIRAEIEGNKAYFRKTKSGRIADKFHPNAGAIKKIVKYNTPALCKAVRKQLG